MMVTFPALHATWQESTFQTPNFYNMDQKTLVDVSTDLQEENLIPFLVNLVNALLHAQTHQWHAVSVWKNMKAKQLMTTCLILS